MREQFQQAMMMGFNMGMSNGMVHNGHLVPTSSLIHQASQEKAEADKRQLQDRLQSLAAEYEHTIAELHEHLEYIADDEAKWRRTAEDHEQRLEIAAVNEKECEQKLEEYKRQVTRLNLAEQRCQLDKNDLRKSLALNWPSMQP